MDTASAPLNVAVSGARFGPSSSMRGGRTWFGLGSVALHGLVLGALLMLVSHFPTPAPPDETTIEMVFQPAEVPPPPPETVTEPQPAPPPPPEPAVAAPPEQPPEKIAEPPAAVPSSAPVITPEPEPPPRIATPPKPKPRPLPRPTVDRVPAAAAPAMKPPAVVQPVPRAVVQPAPPAGAPLKSPVSAAPVVDPSWQAAVFGWISSRKTYPDEARRRAEEGRVAIRFTVDRSGRVLDAAVVGTSGSPLLDQAALALLRQVSLPPFPATMAQARITITTALRYSLR